MHFRKFDMLNLVIGAIAAEIEEAIQLVDEELKVKPLKLQKIH